MLKQDGGAPELQRQAEASEVFYMKVRRGEEIRMKMH